MSENLTEQIISAGAEQPAEVSRAEESTGEEASQQSDDLPTLIAQAFQEDPLGTLSLLAQHAGYQLVPAQQQQQQQLAQAPEMDAWQQLILGVALNMWRSEAAKQVEQLAQADGIELSDQDLQQIFLDALERYQGDVEVAYSKFALPRIRSKQNQPRKEQERDVDASDLTSAIIAAGYR